jgi:hypothetical protein
MGITLFQIALVYKELRAHLEETKYLNLALREFQKINHYRGLALCSKNLALQLGRVNKGYR